VLQHSAYWLTGDKNTEVKPMNKKKKTTQASSYKSHAHFVYEFVKNYRSKGVSMDYLENWNEPEKWWHGNDAYMAPYEYASMSSQDWDAHQDSSGFSIKKASPSTKLVMAGLSDLKSDYVNALSYWCDENRAGQIPWKVVNAHVYANDPKAKKALSPEAFQLEAKVAAFVNNARVSMPNTEVWLSEFGYDRNGDSPQSVPSIPGYSPEEVQAIWLLRSFLLLSSTGLDKAYQYMIRDTRGKGLYTSSGLYKLKDAQIELSEGWYYLKTLRSALGAYHFTRRIPLKEKDIYAFEFENSKGQKAYAVWAGVEARKTYSKTSLNLNFANNTHIQLLQFDKADKGNIKQLKYTPQLEIAITEKPVLLLQELPSVRTYTKIPVTELLIDGSSKPLFDEQDDHDPLLYQHTKPHVLHEARTTTITFSDEKKLSFLCLFDDQGQSDVTIEVFTNDQWSVVYKGKLSLYQKWKSIYVGKACKAIKITHQSNTSKIGEVVLYE
ncbi:MAG TPA: hypothetical protein VL947_11205, partial [Cytophagales bacterium]|nr:hypothetical protein [Cytophagales bacterium]